MNGDVKSIRLNKMNQLVTLLTYFVGARTPTTLKESLCEVIQMNQLDATMIY